ncbi:WYL domain-containing protein [Planctellipticum variicoloris]|uniref:WYL domain-containing protein n=1 Tax=Planctellipticum variicoloris TaxID=3064265 RepID=UPI003AF746ED
MLTKRSDGSTDVEFRLTAFEETLGWSLSFGLHAEILDPPFLRGESAEFLRGTLNDYEQSRSPRFFGRSGDPAQSRRSTK